MFMKAVLFHEHGGPDVLRYDDIQSPRISPNEVLIKVKAVSLNRIDLIVRKGYPGLSIPLPHIPGVDLAGRIEEVGENVDGYAEGDDVIIMPVYGCGKCEYCLKGLENACSKWTMLGLKTMGTYRELINVSPRLLIRMPKNLNYKEAAALPLALLTAWHSTVTIGSLRPGKKVFIWGGSGGVGTYSVQIAKLFGAHVITTAGSNWKANKLKDLGADMVLNHHNDDVVSEVKSHYRDGVDIVIDYVGRNTILKSIELAKPLGKIIVFGMLTGATQEISLQRIYLKHLTIRGMHTGSKWELLEALKFVENGSIKPIIDSVYKLKEAPQAHEKMEKFGHFGKIVLEV